jgi:uncharacterized membrane protein YbhN (UPF0104 family)
VSFTLSSDLVSRYRRWLPWIAVFIVAVLVAASWQRLKSFDWNAFGAVYRSIRWGWMSISASLVLGTYLARVIRWQLMIRPIAPQASALRIFKATAIGFTSVILLGRPGELVRPWLIARGAVFVADGHLVPGARVRSARRFDAIWYRFVRV